MYPWLDFLLSIPSRPHSSRAPALHRHPCSCRILTPQASTDLLAPGRPGPSRPHCRLRELANTPTSPVIPLLPSLSGSSSTHRTKPRYPYCLGFIAVSPSSLFIISWLIPNGPEVPDFLQFPAHICFWVHAFILSCHISLKPIHTPSHSHSPFLLNFLCTLTTQVSYSFSQQPVLTSSLLSLAGLGIMLGPSIMSRYLYSSHSAFYPPGFLTFTLDYKLPEGMGYLLFFLASSGLNDGLIGSKCSKSMWFSNE